MRLSLDIGLGSAAIAGAGGFSPNPVQSGLWAEFAADSGRGLTTRTSGADRFVASWADTVGDGSKAWVQATEASQPQVKRDANGVQYFEYDGVAHILTGNSAVLDWLRGQSNATLVKVSRQRSTPTAVERLLGFSVDGGANQRLVMDCTTGGVRRIQARRDSVDAVTTLTTGVTIPTATTREAIRFRPAAGFVDYIGDNLAESSAALPTSGAIGDLASASAAVGGYANANFCDVDFYYLALYRSALTTEQLTTIWNWADRRFRVNDPF